MNNSERGRSLSKEGDSVILGLMARKTSPMSSSQSAKAKKGSEEGDTVIST